MGAVCTPSPSLPPGWGEPALSAPGLCSRRGAAGTDLALAGGCAGRGILSACAYACLRPCDRHCCMIIKPCHRVPWLLSCACCTHLPCCGIPGRRAAPEPVLDWPWHGPAGGCWPQSVWVFPLGWGNRGCMELRSWLTLLLKAAGSSWPPHGHHFPVGSLSHPWGCSWPALGGGRALSCSHMD